MTFARCVPDACRPAPDGRARGERGAALILALIFLTASAVTVAALLGFANTSSNATIGLRNARGVDYDADSALQDAIATVRATPGSGVSGNCLNGGYTPTWSLNNTSRPIRVDCYPLSSSSQQRHVVLSVCPTSASSPCPDSQAILRADVIFYDTPSHGASVGVQSWSNQ